MHHRDIFFRIYESHIYTVFHKLFRIAIWVEYTKLVFSLFCTYKIECYFFGSLRNPPSFKINIIITIELLNKRAKIKFQHYDIFSRIDVVYMAIIYCRLCYKTRIYWRIYVILVGISNKNNCSKPF